jgi:hypothetical protein
MTYTVVLYTNRQLMVFDESGEQVPELQSAVSCYEIDRVRLDRLLSLPCKFQIAKWTDWRHSISKLEFEYLLGIRTKEQDLNGPRQKPIP